MVEAPFETLAVSPARRPDRGVAGSPATRRRAIRVATITRRADREESVAAPAGSLAKRYVHDVGAASRSDWTRPSNHGTRKTTGSVRRSIEAVTGGLEVVAPGPHLGLAAVLSLCDARTIAHAKRLWTLTQPWTHRTRPPLLGNLADEREIPTASTAPFFFSSEEKKEEHRRRHLSRLTRFQVSADTGLVQTRAQLSR